MTGPGWEAVLPPFVIAARIPKFRKVQPIAPSLFGPEDCRAHLARLAAAAPASRAATVFVHQMKEPKKG